MKLRPNKLDSEWSADPWYIRGFKLSDAFWSAAEILFRAVKVDPEAKQEEIFPAYFLYSHSIELFFKAALSFSSGSFPRTHSLADLNHAWSTAFPSEAKRVPKKVKTFLQHWSLYDPNGENFRYPHAAGVFIDPDCARPMLHETRKWMDETRERVLNTKPKSSA